MLADSDDLFIHLFLAQSNSDGEILATTGESPGKKTTCPLGAGKNRSSPQPKQLSKQTGVKQEMSRVKSEVGVVRERKSRTQEQSKPSEIKSKTPIMQPWIYPSTIF